MSTDVRDRRLSSEPTPAAERRGVRWGVDPRRLVLVVAAVALALGCAATALLWSATQQTRSSLDHLVGSIEPPKTHLLAAERATERGQAALAAAVGAAGPERTRLLSDAILSSQEIASQWTKYKAAAAGLPGERRLVEKYTADNARSEASTSAVLVPILNATTAARLPQAELDSHNQVQNDLIALHGLYADASRNLLSRLERQTARDSTTLGVAAAGGLALLVGTTVVSFRRAGRVLADRSDRHNRSNLTRFDGRLRRALQLVDNDGSAFAIADRATREMLPDARVSVLMADSSGARLTAVGGEPTCGVSTPEECPALRSGSSIRFDDSRDLDACPVLAAHTPEPSSATCVPVAITGRGAAIIHLSGPAGHAPDDLGVATLVARNVGDRVTLLQALATFQLQAARDPLTGLLNRRSLESAVGQLLAGTKRYAVAFGDLDNFKQLNDLHGHDAGDRALRAFARTLRESLRPQDITCRWGGEEFVIVLPDCDTERATEAMDRVRTNLALGSIGGNTAAVTASFGVAQSLDAESFDEVVARADSALRRAKDAGRNRVVGYDPAVGPNATVS